MWNGSWLRTRTAFFMDSWTRFTGSSVLPHGRAAVRSELRQEGISARQIGRAELCDFRKAAGDWKLAALLAWNTAIGSGQSGSGCYLSEEDLEGAGLLP